MDRGQNNHSRTRKLAHPTEIACSTKKEKHMVLNTEYGGGDYKYNIRNPIDTLIILHSILPAYVREWHNDIINHIQSHIPDVIAPIESAIYPVLCVPPIPHTLYPRRIHLNRNAITPHRDCAGALLPLCRLPSLLPHIHFTHRKHCTVPSHLTSLQRGPNPRRLLW